MDSLLANYGSDEEDADSPPRLPNPVVKTSGAPVPSRSRHSFFGSLPPPRNSAPETSLWDDEDEPVKTLKRNRGVDEQDRSEPVSSFLTGLPPPKNSAPESTDWGEPLIKSDGPSRNRLFDTANDDRAERELGSAPFPPRLGSTALPSGFFADTTSDSHVERPSHHDDIPERLTGDLLSLVSPGPLPASKSLFEKLPPPSTTKAKKVVSFRPPVNLALLETTEEDDLERTRKRSKLSKENDRATNPKAGGLAALLPPPKNNLGVGAALGGGGTHGGRRTIMEIAAKEVNSNSGRTAHTEDARNLEKAEEDSTFPEQGVSNFGYGIEPPAHSSGVSYAQPDSRYYDPQFQRSGEGSLVGQQHDSQSWQYPEASAFGSGSEPVENQGRAPNAIQELMKERRKGRDELPPAMIEVKQADLTGGPKLREDQLRATGIAFGPSYKPASSTKDKPSKLHRRKHQLGALYFDMKQNEMNLVDRRFKGSLTKAETQAKYGW